MELDLPVSAHSILVLDGLFDDLDVEIAVAAARGWSVRRWDGDEPMLREAEVVVHVRTKVDRGLMDRMLACRVVGRFGTGLDTVDQVAAAERGIRVIGVRDYCIPELASLTLGLAFALDRRVDGVRTGMLGADDSWHVVASRVSLPGRTAATVVGLGSVGTAVTRALIAIGISVRVVTKHGGDRASVLGATSVGLSEGLAGAGFVFLHAALSVETQGMIDDKALALMSPGTILVNTARIGLVDESAVAASLRSGHLGGLGLDARLAPDSPLRALLGNPRMMITPHIGWYSARSAQELRERTIRAAIEAFGDREAPAAVPIEGGGL
jgi:phosphoglycerate dehydrogenase-like enzyme